MEHVIPKGIELLRPSYCVILHLPVLGGESLQNMGCFVAIQRPLLWLVRTSSWMIELILQCARSLSRSIVPLYVDELEVRIEVARVCKFLNRALTCNSSEVYRSPGVMADDDEVWF